MSPLANRNLLFGILALQINFISREQLLAAFNAWIVAKEKPLDQILLAQNALDSDTRALLNALVAKHLAMHGNDPQQSLAALSSLGSGRQDLQQLADADVQASLAIISKAADDDSHLTRSRFRILRPHAGKVSVAMDEELRREVALKEIKEKHADDPGSRGRFILEAEITGGLEHPGIVPVYGLGTYADGRPFYAMRFIKGDSLKDAIDRFHSTSRGAGAIHSLEFRKLLSRFIDVCNAIAYAHSRGVLHRDLKPGNIMLGKYGETLVVDWGRAGLAKAGVRAQESGVRSPESHQPEAQAPLKPASSSGSAETVAGSAIGTPQFMSPEQAAGRLDLLGPASDVYSLGATLYCLLTGKAPIEESDVGTVLRKVQKGEFLPPRQVNSKIPRALDAVCRKAMALHQQDRYRSPRDLADDVERWLADEPVTAYRDPPARALSRWLTRHSRVVICGLIVVVTLLGLSLASILIVGGLAR